MSSAPAIAATADSAAAACTDFRAPRSASPPSMVAISTDGGGGGSGSSRSNNSSGGDGSSGNTDSDNYDSTADGSSSSSSPVVVLSENALTQIATNGRIRATGPPSIASTLATSVGSVLGQERDAFLKSFTFYKKTVCHPDNTASNGGLTVDENTGALIVDETIVPAITAVTAAAIAPSDDGSSSTSTRNRKQQQQQQHTKLPWNIVFQPSMPGAGKGWNWKNRFTKSGKQQQKLVIDKVEGCLQLSRIEEGDYLKTINGHKVGPSLYSAELVLEKCAQVLNRDGYLSISAARREGDDILVHATILKPRPDMTYEEMGMVVWKWGYLCIKSISNDSIFKPSVLKSNDHIFSINEIPCDKMTPEQFAQVLTTLPYDITITVLRRKQRVSGKFG